MQIFIVNTHQGGTITLDVNPDDTVGALKTKLEAKTSIPLTRQRLSFDGKCLLNPYILRHYDVQKESMLHLQVPTIRAVDWDMFVKDAKFKVDKHIHQKKKAYDDLMMKRVTEHKKLETLVMELGIHSREFSDASSQMHSKDEEVALRELKLLESLRERDGLKGLKDFASKKIKETRGQIDNVKLKISKINEEIGRTLDIDICSKKSDSFKDILIEAITQKEVDLQCPVCYVVSPPPLYKCTREHLICSECFARVHNKCPTCRSGYSSDDKIFRLAEQNWRDLQKLKSKLA